MFGSFLIALREGLEAALVIGIILAYLNRTGNRRGFRPVWMGTGLAILGSLAAGGVIYALAGEFEGRGEQIFEGAALLFAVGILTWMIFWMRRQAANIRASLQSQIDSVANRNSLFGLAAIAFLAVIREGIELAVFLFAAVSGESSPVLFALGVALGLAAATAIGYTIYKGTSRLNLRTFFNATSVVLIVIAAGLLARAIGEFNEAGIVPTVAGHVWDTSRFIPEDSTLGRFLTAIFGYSPSPSLAQVLGYFVYLSATLTGYIYAIRPGGNKRNVAGGPVQAAKN